MRPTSRMILDAQAVARRPTITPDHVQDSIGTFARLRTELEQQAVALRDALKRRTVTTRLRRDLDDLRQAMATAPRLTVPLGLSVRAVAREGRGANSRLTPLVGLTITLRIGEEEIGDAQTDITGMAIVVPTRPPKPGTPVEVQLHAPDGAVVARHRTQWTADGGGAHLVETASSRSLSPAVARGAPFHAAMEAAEAEVDAFERSMKARLTREIRVVEQQIIAVERSLAACQPHPER